MSINPIDLTKDIEENYIQYLSGMFHLNDPRLRKIFLNEINKFRFIKGPYLEATPPFKKGSHLNELINEGLLQKEFQSFIFEALPYLKDNPLYLHQENAIRKLLRGRNLVISSGTSSGKTECFLLTIYNHLINEYRKNGNLEPGVRALLLYPMNALANDQLRRLREIAKVIEKNIPDLKITFGRYTGDTRNETRERAIERFVQMNPGDTPVNSELLTRNEMQTNPPHILITNYAMLEYLLLRPDDSPFFDGQYAHNWKFLVLDETHIYSGAQGIEMALLIRRLKDRICDSMRGELQCIATSATLVTDAEDFEKVSEFASELFGERIEWDENEEERQDIIQGQRIEFHINQSESKFPLKLYKDLEDAIFKSNSGIDECIEILKIHNISKEIFENAFTHSKGEIKKFIYHLLLFDKNISELKIILKNGSEELNNCIKLLLKKQKLNELERQSIISLVNLSVWAKLEDESLPLLPARYHLFVRAPEGAFISFYPKEAIFLERRESTKDGYPVFELSTCKRCGQEYLVGHIKDNKLKHTFSEIPLAEEHIDRSRNKYFILWNKDINFEDDEDQEIAIPDELSKKGEEWRLCVKCGQIYKTEANKCSCSSNEKTERLLIEIKPNNQVLNKCYACSLRSNNIVKKFIFSQNDLNSILVTVLYQNQNKTMVKSPNSKYKKILAFSDSRQGAAYFAPFLESEYHKILYRRLIIKALDENKAYNDYGLTSLAQDILATAKKFNLFKTSLDEKQKSEIIWRWVIYEFCALFDKRNSLEKVGMISFKPILPREWKPIKELKEDPWNLTENEAINLYIVLLNTLRYNFATSLPVIIDPSDIFFSPLNREYKFREEASDSHKGIYSFIPSKNRHNARMDFVKKLYFRINGDENNYECKNILGLIWRDLIVNWREKGFIGFTKKSEGTLYKIDYKFWRVLRRKSTDSWYYCDKCGTLMPFSIKGTCTTYNCSGSIKRLDDNFKNLRNDFYEKMYLKFKPVRLVSHEHTAQLKSEYASEIQQKFIRGDINILSCSTTFELGVDLGNLESIFLRNVPPEPSNYVQRAGRAGRRLDIVGYTVTFVHLRSHDLSYFRDPRSMIDGRISPPELTLSNEKIVRRHIHSIALADFFKKHKDYYGVLDKFMRFEQNDSGVKTFINYLKLKPNSILESIKRVIPKSMYNVFEVNDWGWLSGIIDSEEGILSLTEMKVTDQYNRLLDYYKDKEEQWKNEKKQSVRDKINDDMNWASRRIETVKRQRLIEFLASNTVIPKYGFPVDVVDLLILSKTEDANNIKLERDLRIGISEFAPGCEVVANGYIWKSEGLRLIKNKQWPVYWYGFCSVCGQFFLKESTWDDQPPKFECKLHGVISKKKLKKFIKPIFGFTTSLGTKPKNANVFRPKREYTTRPFFYEYKKFDEKHIKIGRISLNLRYAPHGELAVICTGKDGVGFRICLTCGASFSYKERPTKHLSPYGTKCTGVIRGPLHLGHTFMTDVILLSFVDPPINENISFCLSLLYGILEGISEALGIKRGDLNGCLYQTENGIVFVFFDDVPGGAGHVRRLLKEGNLEKIFHCTLQRLDNCTCGEETSCYSCLRNYQNQFCHHILRRDIVAEFLRDYLSDKEQNRNITGVSDDVRLKIGHQGEENAFNLLKKIKLSEYEVDKNSQRKIFEEFGHFKIVENGSVILTAIWENANEEQFKGYDISFKDENNQKYYIEVKSTTSSTKDWFNISKNEWKYFVDKKEKYFIFRVYDVKVGELSIENINVIENPYKEWIEGKLKAYPYKLEL